MGHYHKALSYCGVVHVRHANEICRNILSNNVGRYGNVIEPVRTILYADGVPAFVFLQNRPSFSNSVYVRILVSVTDERQLSLPWLTWGEEIRDTGLAGLWWPQRVVLFIWFLIRPVPEHPCYPFQAVLEVFYDKSHRGIGSRNPYEDFLLV